MTRKGTTLNKSTAISIAALVLLIALIAAGLVLSQSYFNAKELQVLLDGAAAQDIGYEVQIHNPWTGRYSFFPEVG
ncbi:hypothetical protein CJEDD_02525 [Corynebacterium jeddahense]|uniref:Secreted protein n=1 Tax=Corynebacterium jeddahense TaxID=1414719 RepID=A0ABY7UIR7_9CORY|nr:hypothetical protein CJEDD_02525 [Corynebacterium jeddahense]